MRYRLRTLLILLVVGPPLGAAGYTGWQEWRRSQRITYGPSLRQLNIASQNSTVTPVHRPQK